MTLEVTFNKGRKKIPNNFQTFRTVQEYSHDQKTKKTLFFIVNVPDPLLHHLKKYWVPATPRPNVLPKAGRLTGTVQQVLECAARSWSLIVVQPWTITVPTFKTHHIQQRIQLQDLVHIPYHL